MLRLLIAILFFPVASYAQLTPADLLRRIRETYAGANQYRFVTRLVETRESGVKPKGSAELVVDRRGRMWFKAVGGAAVSWSGGREENTLITVADGRAVWVYLKGQKLYKKAIGNPEPRGTDSDDDNIDSPKAFARQLMFTGLLRYTKFEGRADRAKIAREESCTLNGLRSDCYVLEFAVDTIGPEVTSAVYRLWVDKQRYLVLRDDISVVDKVDGKYTTSVIYDIANLDVEVPEKLFSFTPPPGAKEVRTFFQ